MEPRDPTPLPEPAAQRTPPPSAGALGLAGSEMEAPITPRLARPSGSSMQVLATPIISVALTPRAAEASSPSAAAPIADPPYEVVKPVKSSPNASAWPVAAAPSAPAERPAGMVVEGVTLVEPRPVPGNGAELDSVILGPGVQSQPRLPREGEQRRAPTIRTRVPFRPLPVPPMSSPREPSRRSSTLLAGVVAIALVLMGVSALLRTESDDVEHSTEAVEPAVPHARVAVQAAVPQPSARVAEAESAAHADVEPLPSSMQAAAATGRLDVAARPVAPAPLPRTIMASQRSAPKRAARSVESVTRVPTAPGEGKSWIKVRD